MRHSSTRAFQKSIAGQVCSIVISACFLSLAGCGSGGAGGEGGPIITTTSAPAGATASLTWDPVTDPSVVGYYIHYGKQSLGQAGSCAYEDAKFVTNPYGTVTGLDTGSRYYFAVSAYNGVESSCSNEVSTGT
jgi:hypothetical protein